MFWIKGSLPRWVVFFIDIFICAFSLTLAYNLRFNFSIPPHILSNFHYSLFFVVIVRAAVFYIAKVYSGIIRYTNTSDVVLIFISISAGSIIFSFSNLMSLFFITGKHIIPFSIVIIDYITCIFCLVSYRLLIKVMYMDFAYSGKSIINVAIYGAGEAGIIAKRAMDSDPVVQYNIIAFIDDNPAKIGKKLEGIIIVDGRELKKLFEKNKVSNLVLAIQNFPQHKKKSIIECALNHDVKVLNVPPVERWIKGELSFKQIKDVKIEDLLQREEIHLEKENILKQLADKTVFVTGAAGSIGSELAFQIATFPVKKLVLIDQGETQVFHLEAEFITKYPNVDVNFVIGDIRDENRIKYLFEEYKPEIVFHAAAYKHVPIMETNAYEAIWANVAGTKILADNSLRFNVSKFVMISTDKAVNPTNVMGASKRIAEMYIQGLNQHCKTRFITTRFGNVLGSNGSVIPLFKKQIENGGPVTITHPEVTRYFMTIPEACQLVLEAGAMGKGGEIFIFDMGESVKILDLAKNIIKLSGLEPGKDIEIIYTGLRAGEKLYEELLNNAENTIPTHHPRIMIANTEVHPISEVEQSVNELLNLSKKCDDFNIVRKMKEIIPNFISNNSIYEELDKN
ncbi:MAG: polysaccharide biosynthesis protein [Bacteroidetes bacterium]|nr:polysaccharide biosynthesis protein [Bacteroidota bacterium]